MLLTPSRALSPTSQPSDAIAGAQKDDRVELLYFNLSGILEESEVAQLRSGHMDGNVGRVGYVRLWCRVSLLVVVLV